MATVNKDFKLKNGLIVEGTNATVNGNQVLTENASDQYIIDLIGGETLVTSVNPDQLEVVSGELSVKSGVFDADGAAAAAELAANSYTDGEISTALTTAQGYADAAEADANSYTDGRETAITTAYQGYADQVELDAVSTANSYTDGEITTALTTAQGYANTAEANAEDYTDTALLDYTTTANLDTTVGGYGYLKSADLSGYATESYVGTAIDNLVDGAPGLLDTLNEIAAAINDDENYATTMTTALAGKQNNLTAGTGIDIVSDTISVTANTYDAYGAASTAETNANSYTDGEITTALSTAQGYADTAESDANSYTDGEITTALTTAQGYANTAESNANTYTDNSINALDTDDIEEGSTNLYFTDGRAKTSAAELLTGATLTNITITGNGSGLTITAENGVADSTTTDLAEGDNLYFTDARAVDALEAVVPNFTAVELNSVAKQVAATLSAPTAGIQIGHTFAKADYRSAEYLVKVAYGDHTEISKVLLTLDVNDNIAITEYGIVGTNGSASSVSADISGTNVRLLVTTSNNNSTVTVMGTLLV
jgi:hypothetical protein